MLWQTRASTVGALLAVLVVLLTMLAATASAGQITFVRGDDVWVAGDDGSSPRVLFTPGLSSVRDVTIPPGGDTVVFGASSGLGMYATYAEALYRWQAGKLERLSPPAAANRTLTTSETDADATADGRVVAEYEAYTYEYSCTLYGCDYWPLDHLAKLVARPVTGGATTDLATSCQSARDPAANPANAAEIAYIGCDATDNQGATGDALIARNGGAERVIAYDDAEQADPSWSLDGTRIAVVEQGTEPGLWVYGAGGTGPSVQVLGTTGDTRITSPRFIGNDRIAFVAAGDVWVAGASATGATFPGPATRLTSVGQVRSLAWTSANAIRTSVTPPTPPQPPAPQQPSQPLLSLTKVKTVKLSTLRRRGLKLAFVTAAAGRVTARATVTARVARKLRMKVKRGAKRVVVATGSARVAKAGKGTVTLKLAQAARRRATRLRKAKLAVTVTFKPVAGATIMRSLTVTIR